MEDRNARKDIKEFLSARGVLTLATQSDNGPWVCTLYYGMDKDLNLFVVTDSESDHGRHIDNDNRIAFNIFDSNQKIVGLKKGVQGRGVAEIVNGVEDMVFGLRAWYSHNKGAEKSVSIEDIRKFKNTKIFKIIPSYIKYFNKELYPENGYGIWERE